MKIDNEPDFIDGKYLGEISSDFVKLADQLKEASYQIRERGFTPFPVFLISKVEIKVGQLLYKRFELNNEWYYYVSMLDELIQTGLVSDGEQFKASYKDADEYCCLLVVDVEFVNFVYIPYPEE